MGEQLFKEMESNVYYSVASVPITHCRCFLVLSLHIKLQCCYPIPFKDIEH